ncbi:MAG: hypothetical protein H6940_06570 [Burkholderiales bacterium]|nr:hypothetical protein [Burkholderiales bacterium]
MRKDEPKTEVLSYQLDSGFRSKVSDNLISIGALKFANIGNELQERYGGFKAN